MLAINKVARPCMIAVPSILIVAPSGRTNDETSSETPSSFSHLSIVTGSVAPLELVEKARS